MSVSTPPFSRPPNSRSGLTAFVLALLVVAAVPEASAQHVFLSESEAEAIDRKIDEGERPWSRMLESVVRAADRRLGMRPRSVVDNGAPRAGDVHDYGTDAPYVSDGVYDKQANREDYEAAAAMSHAVRDLGLAYRFTGRDRYARKAIELIHHWTVDSRTYMSPEQKVHGAHTPGFRPNNEIELYITLPAMVYGASFVRGHPYWDELGGRAESRFVDWVRDFLADAERRGDPFQNNIHVWHTLLRATFASFLGDTGSLRSAFEIWKDLADRITAEGFVEGDSRRTRGLFYSMYGLKAYVLTAEIARHHGTNLYGYEDGRGGKVLKRAFDRHVPYLLGTEPWPYEQISDLDLSDAVVPYELAYSRWRESGYRKVIEKAGRPLRSGYVLGETVSLTHAQLFELEGGGGDAPARPPEEGDGGSNEAPRVQITAPSDGSVLEPGPLTIEAEGTDADGSVVSIRFYVDGERVGIDPEEPYTQEVGHLPSGTHVLGARSVDDQGTLSDPKIVAVTVGRTEDSPPGDGGSNRAPRVQITAPTDGSALQPGRLTIEAEGTDADGSVVSIRFYVNGERVGIDPEEPYTQELSHLRSGTHVLGARSVDDQGTLSDPKIVTVEVSGSKDSTSPPSSSGKRVTDGLEVLYGFAEGGGRTIRDEAASSGRTDLRITDPDHVQWSDGGLRVDRPTRILSTEPARELTETIRRHGAITVEAWIRPARLDQDGPARIVSLSRDLYHRDFTLGQGRWGDQPSDVIDVRLRTSETSASGRPSITSAPGTLERELTHVAYTRATDGTARLYLDGELAAEEQVEGSLHGWKPYRLLLANEFEGDRPWLGTYRLVAVYSRALDRSEITRNLETGPDAREQVEASTAGGREARSFETSRVRRDSSLRLTGNYPNPFNPTTTISYELGSPMPVRIEVYDVLGKRVRVLVDRVQAAGRHRHRFDASMLPSGTYFYRLRAGEQVRTGRMTLQK